MKLRIDKSGERVGWLESTAEQGIRFTYDADFARRPGACALSLSLPVRAEPYSQAQCLPFFAGLLPDGDLRRRIADWLHISENSALRLLEALGGECAGTVRIIRDDAEDERESHSPSYEEISIDQLSTLIREAERIPLLAPRGGIRLSLAGAQDKLPLLHREDRWFRPLGGAPSSHILKPAAPSFSGIVTNEYACLELARGLGFKVTRAEIIDLGRPVLVLERFDRVMGEDGLPERLHQEDCCQALGIMPDRKYQADGGPGFADLAKLVRRTSTEPLADIEALIDIACFNFLVGNCDAHGKNFSLLTHGEKLSLAPFYDLVATTVWPALNTKLSMRIGKEYRLERVSASDLDGLAADLGVKPSAVRKRRDAIIEAAPSAWEALFAAPELAASEDLVGRMRKGWDERARRLVGKE